MLADFALVEFGLGFLSSFVLTLVGIKLRNRHLALNALAGVKSEVKQNREEATTIIKDLSEDIKSDQVGKERFSRSTTELSTSAYDNFTDSGHVGILSEELQEQLRVHYTEIRMINGELRDRRKRKLGSGNNSDVSPGHDDGGTLLDMLVFCSEEHQEEILEKMENNPVDGAVNQLQGLISLGLAEESETAKRDDIDFDIIYQAIEADLEDRLLNSLYKYSSEPK